MKYIVMECHPAYAVLMDEASRFVRAANLHYEVGQVVESPMLLQEEKKPHISVTTQRFIAAAACVALLIGGGALYYHGNYTAYSSIVVCAEANVRMDVSRSGKVLSVEPLNQDAAQLLSDYQYNGKDQITVTNELIERAVEGGYVQQGDTVGVYYQKEKHKDSEQFQEDVEKSIAAHNLQADIHDDLEHSVIPPEPPEPPVTPPAEKPDPSVAPHPEKETPVPPAPHQNDEKPEPEAPVHPDKDPAPKPGEEPEKPVPPIDPAHDAAADPEAPLPEVPAGESADNPPAPPAENPPESPLDSAPVPPAEHIHPPRAELHADAPVPPVLPEE